MAADYKQPANAEKRVRFFDGQYLQDQDFIDEQKYHIDRQRCHNRMLHIAGIAEGLEVRPAASQDKAGAAQVSVTAGTAVDENGRQLVLAQDQTIDLPLANFKDKTAAIYIVYEETAADPQTAGGIESDSRWLERPVIVSAVKGEALQRDYPPVLLAQLSLDGNGAITENNTAMREYSGLRLPGPNAPSPTLRSDANGRVTLTGGLSVTGNVGIGTTDPDASLHVAGNDGVLLGGTYNSGTIPAKGAGVRMMWYPKKAALRAGRVASVPKDGGSLKDDYWNDANIGSYSVALGFNTQGTGSSSTAMGRYSTASGNYSTAMGEQATASGSGSTAMGQFTWATGRTSTAMGNQSSATGINSTAMGDQTTASGNSSTAMGSSTTASGSYSTAMGRATTASAFYSTAMGYSTSANGNYSIAAGRQAKAEYSGTFVWADDSVSSDFESTAANQFLIRAVGGVGIGKNKPSTALDVEGTVSATKFVGDGAIPKGVIVMWSGTTATIPTFWALCDGTQGTPDLRSRFIVCAGSGYSPGNKGSPDQHSHALDIPRKTFSTSNNGSHNHAPPSAWYNRAYSWYAAVVSKTFSGIDRGGSSVKSVRTSTEGSHNHTVAVYYPQISSNLSSGSNRPYWYALAFIMKL